ncbi:hypothetical protein E2C01_061360 [Portunus trituberculatus]|uniref:Uncharacterized protein n=1 Tax=Portunus trituberculatus TaxID=210409 RepID=A0A5B7HAQ3_PORTR|nr:hypothetical protein [Portunus trituberculatus]
MPKLSDLQAGVLFTGNGEPNSGAARHLCLGELEERAPSSTKVSLRTVEKWYALSNEVVTAHNVHNFKEKLDNWRQDTMRTAQTLYNATR